MKLRTALAGAVVCGLMAAPTYAQVLGLNGTWRLNHEKSQGPQDASEVFTITVTGDDEHYVIHEVTKDGKKHEGEYRAKFDGMEYVQKNLTPEAAPAAGGGAVHYVKLKKMFDRVEEVTNLRRMPGEASSKVTSYYIRQLSPDNKTLYDTLINTDGQITAFRVFDKIKGDSTASAQ